MRAPESILIGSKQLFFPHTNPGFLNQNITINRNIFSNDTLKDSLTEIIVVKNTYFKIEPHKIFNIVTPILPVLGSTNFIIQDSALLFLDTNSQIIVDNQNKLTLKNKGQISLSTNSKIDFRAGSLYCNEGGKITSVGTSRGIIFFNSGFHYYNCSELSDFLIEDSIRLELGENAIVQIPNNTDILIRSNATSLILNPGSKLLFGENSGIICDSGGKLIANNATFSSTDSTKKWNGISLSDLSQDTIKNCTIKNAMYGICVSGKYDAEDTGIPYSTEISGCSFINQTNYVLNNGVYIAGSNNVLIKNNSFYSVSASTGFTHGIYAEYCSEGNFNILGNNISNSTGGMTIIQSSPFVAQNTLNGNSESLYGMFLDNSNGTIEYNIITDFYYSYFSYYSSPNLLKNVFDNSYDDNIFLSGYSVPVMRPLVSGSLTYWFSGDNLITGSAANSGINFGDEAYPDMNYGYNRFILSNNDYFINGT